MWRRRIPRSAQEHDVAGWNINVRHLDLRTLDRVRLAMIRRSAESTGRRIEVVFPARMAPQYFRLLRRCSELDEWEMPRRMEGVHYRGVRVRLSPTRKA